MYDIDDDQLQTAALTMVKKNPQAAVRLADNIRRAAGGGGSLLVPRSKAPTRRLGGVMTPREAAGRSGAAVGADVLVRLADLEDRMRFTDARTDFRGSNFNQGDGPIYTDITDPAYYGPISFEPYSASDKQAAGTFFFLTLDDDARARMCDGVIERLDFAIQAGNQSGGQWLVQAGNAVVTLLKNNVPNVMLNVNLQNVINSNVGTPLGFNVRVRVKPTDRVKVRVDVNAAFTGTVGGTSLIYCTAQTSSPLAAR